MRKFLYIFSVALLALSCKVELLNPYEGSAFDIEISVVYPEGYEEFLRGGIDVLVDDVNLGYSYKSAIDGQGNVTFHLPNGIYSIKASDKAGENIFNATISKFVVNGAAERVSLPMKRSKSGSIVIKEIYCGGCTKQDDNKTYQSDKYVIIHNNDYQVQYLDGLCFGALDPHNSSSVSHFVDVAADGSVSFRDYLPIAEALWSFPGEGTDFPLGPGEDAVICLTGAINHYALYPMSVNLNNSDYFVCYDNNAYTNETYHPTPGTEIRRDHHMVLVEKLGKANAYTFSMNSPAVVLYRIQGMTPAEYVRTDEGTIPGSTTGTRDLKLPVEWVVDAVEVFYKGTSTNNKRLSPELDAGAVYLSATGKGHTLMRKTDEENTASAGYEILLDTNDSSNDFYERETQSLHN